MTARSAQPSGRDSNSRTVAVCDLGTYSGLILIARRSGHRWSSLVEERHTIDLLSDSGRDRRLHRRAFERAAGLLDRFDTVVRRFGDARAAIVCTSAVREAVNRERFVAALRNTSEHSIHVLSARREATLSASGALIGLRPSKRPTAVVDIGGGSTEVVFLDGPRNRFWLTDCGAARATEDWKMLHAQPVAQRVQAFISSAGSILRDLMAPGCRPHRIVGVGGTIVTLAAIYSGLLEFDSRRLHGMSLPASWIVSTGKRLARLDHEQIVRLIPFDPDRARVLAAGTILWAGVLNRLSADRIVVSARGLRWGVAARLAEGRSV